MNLTSLKDILEAREARVEKQCGLLSCGGILVSFSLNIPGPAKNAALYRKVFEEGLRLLGQIPELEGTLPETEESAAGPCAFLLIKTEPGKKDGEKALEIKKRVMAVEENGVLGRLFDIDVLYPGEGGYPEKVSRTELGAEPRECLVCGDRAFVCVRTGRHRVPEVLMKVTDRILSSETIQKRIFSVTEMTAAEKIALEALRAVLYEVATTPKPGLVDAENNGAHRDMDITAFFDSALAIAPYFRDCVQTGMDRAEGPADKLLPVLRPLGIRAEEEMYRATGGVNTHKGAVFTLGLFCAAAGISCVKELPAKQIPLLAGEIASSMENGTRGIRTEAMNGYPSLRASMQAVFGEDGEPDTRETDNDTGVRLLLELMSRVDDSNAVRRKGEAAAGSIRERAEKVLRETGECKTDADRCGKELLRKAEELDRELIGENISPGGSADLLAAGYFLRMFETLRKNGNSSKL